MTSRAPQLLTSVGVFVLCLTLASCAAVRARRSAPELSGFLGDYSQLREDPDFDAQLVYRDAVAPWTRYRAIHLDSVTLWAEAKNTKLSAEEQQMLTDLLYTALSESLGQEFELADRAGPHVLRVRAAFTQASGANVPLRTVTSILPPAFLLSTAAGLSTDSAFVVGTATVEIEVVDAITGRRLAAAVDSRAGTKSILAGTRTFTTWGDVQAAARFWANRVTSFLKEQGVQRKPGAAVAPLPEQP